MRFVQIFHQRIFACSGKKQNLERSHRCPSRDDEQRWREPMNCSQRVLNVRATAPVLVNIMARLIKKLDFSTISLTLWGTPHQRAIFPIDKFPAVLTVAKSNMLSELLCLCFLGVRYDPLGSVSGDQF